MTFFVSSHFNCISIWICNDIYSTLNRIQCFLVYFAHFNCVSTRCFDCTWEEWSCTCCECCFSRICTTSDRCTVCFCYRNHILNFTSIIWSCCVISDIVFFSSIFECDCKVRIVFIPVYCVVSSFYYLYEIRFFTRCCFVHWRCIVHD